MKSTHGITNDFLKKYGEKTEMESRTIPSGKEYIYDVRLRSRTLFDTLLMDFPSNAELEQRAERRATEIFHDAIFEGKSGVVIYPEEIIEFQNNVEEMAKKTGNIFAVMEVVYAFCMKFAMTK